MLLRDFHLEDETGIYEYASDPEVVRFADWGPAIDYPGNLHRRLEDQESWPRDSIEVAVELRTDTCLIGIMRITGLDRANRTADFGTLSTGAIGITAMQLKLLGLLCIWLSQILICIACGQPVMSETVRRIA